MLRFKPTVLMIFLTTMSVSSVATEQLLSLSQGFVRAMPAQVPNTAAYFTLHNHSQQPKTLIKVSTTIAKEAQLHTIVEENGLVKMKQMTELFIPAQSERTLQSHGDHIMLLGLYQPLQVQQQVELMLHFKDGSQQTITLPVQKISPEIAEHHSPHNHQDH